MKIKVAMIAALCLTATSAFALEFTPREIIIDATFADVCARVMPRSKLCEGLGNRPTLEEMQAFFANARVVSDKLYKEKYSKGVPFATGKVTLTDGSTFAWSMDSNKVGQLLEYYYINEDSNPIIVTQFNIIDGGLK